MNNFTMLKAHSVPDYLSNVKAMNVFGVCLPHKVLNDASTIGQKTSFLAL